MHDDDRIIDIVVSSLPTAVFGFVPRATRRRPFPRENRFEICALVKKRVTCTVQRYGHILIDISTEWAEL